MMHGALDDIVTASLPNPDNEAVLCVTSLILPV